MCKIALRRSTESEPQLARSPTPANDVNVSIYTIFFFVSAFLADAPRHVVHATLFSSSVAGLAHATSTCSAPDLSLWSPNRYDAVAFAWCVDVTPHCLTINGCITGTCTITSVGVAMGTQGFIQFSHGKICPVSKLKIPKQRLQLPTRPKTPGLKTHTEEITKP